MNQMNPPTHFFIQQTTKEGYFGYLTPQNIYFQPFPFTCRTKEGRRGAYFSKGSVILAKFLWKRKAWMSWVSILGGRSPCKPSICRSCNVKAIPWKQKREKSEITCLIFFFLQHFHLSWIYLIYFCHYPLPGRSWLEYPKCYHSGVSLERYFGVGALQQLPQGTDLGILGSAGALLRGFPSWARLFLCAESSGALSQMSFPSVKREKSDEIPPQMFRTQTTAGSWNISQK